MYKDVHESSFCNVSPLSSLAEVRIGYSFRSGLYAEPDGDVSVIQMKDIDDANLLHTETLLRIHMPELSPRHLVQQGDLVFRSRGGFNTAALVGADLGRTVLAAPMMIIRPQSTLIEPAYLQWFINHHKTQDAIARRSAGSAVKMINKAELYGLEVPIPPIDLQRQVVEIAKLAAEEARLSAELTQKRRLLIEQTLLLRVQPQMRESR